MKAVAKLGKAFGGLVLLVALMAFITGVSLFVVGGYLTSWPILRLSPRGRRTQAVMQFVAAGMTLASVLQADSDEQEG